MRVADVALVVCVVGESLSGCASGLGPVPESIQSQVDKRVTFEQLLDDADAHVGKMVMLGGQVLQAKRLPDATRMEILQLPLDDSDRPSSELQSSKGRFLAFEPLFLDPATLSDQPRVTIAGEVTGRVSAPLDEVEYSYPTLSIKHLHNWDAQSAGSYKGFGIDFGIAGGSGGYGGVGIGTGTGF